MGTLLYASLMATTYPCSIGVQASKKGGAANQASGGLGALREMQHQPLRAWSARKLTPEARVRIPAKAIRHSNAKRPVVPEFSIARADGRYLPTCGLVTFSARGSGSGGLFIVAGLAGLLGLLFVTRQLLLPTTSVRSRRSEAAVGPTAQDRGAGSRARIRIALEEWKQRSDSVKELQRLYLTTISIGATGYVLAAAIAANPQTLDVARVAILMAATVWLGAIVVAHLLGLRALAALTTRLQELEASLGIRQLESTVLLRSAARITLVCTAFVLVLTVALGSLFLAQTR